MLRCKPWRPRRDAKSSANTIEGLRLPIGAAINVAPQPDGIPIRKSKIRRKEFSVKRLMTVLLASLLLAPSALADWEQRDFLICLWGQPQAGDAEARARALAEAGFTVVSWDANDLDMLTAHGLKAMVHQATPELAAKLASHSSVWGYHLVDEPYPEDQFPPLAERVRALAKADPNHVAFINMLSTTGEFLRTYLSIVKPELLSFDYYQWWWGSDRYFEKLEQFREAALLAGIPLASCIEVSANPAVERGDMTYLPDNAPKLRQSVYTTLAYGAKGIEWFSASLLFEPKTTRLTPAGRDVAALNHELRRIGPVMMPLRSVDVYHTPPLAAGVRTAPKEHWVHLIGEEGRPGLVQGMFKDASGVDYMLVANRDYRQPQSVVVRLQSKWLGIAPWQKPKRYKYAVERFDKTDGKWIEITSSSAVGFTFVIQPGDGELLKIITTVE